MRSRAKVLTLFVISTVLAALPALGDAIPYPNYGAIVPPAETTAAATGQFVAYFDGSTATHTDMVAVKDVTAGWTSPWFFSNHSTAVGSSFVAGNVMAGDVLEFLLFDKWTDNTYSSNPADSPDGIDHFFVTPHTAVGPSGIPVGTYVAGEDLSLAISDFNYADDDYVYAITSVPEPATLAMVGLGLIAVGLIRRIRSHTLNQG